MYERYWGLNASPFQGTTDVRWFVETPAHEEAVARLLFLIDQRRRFGLLSAPAGTGKSLVLQAVRRESQRSGRLNAWLDLFGLDSHELLWQMALAMQLSPSDNCSRWWLWQAVSDHFAALHAARLPAVLIADHLDRAEADCAGLLERLLHLPAAQDGCLTLLTAARNDSDVWLNRELAQLSDLRVELTLLSRSESAQVIRERLHRAGSDRTIFDPSALDALHQLSRGEPRGLLRLADLALAAGAHQECDTLDSRIVREIAGELPARPRQPAGRELLSSV